MPGYVLLIFVDKPGCTLDRRLIDRVPRFGQRVVARDNKRNCPCKGKQESRRRALGVVYVNHIDRWHQTVGRNGGSNDGPDGDVFNQGQSLGESDVTHQDMLPHRVKLQRLDQADEMLARTVKRLRQVYVTNMQA